MDNRSNMVRLCKVKASSHLTPLRRHSYTVITLVWLILVTTLSGHADDKLLKKPVISELENKIELINANSNMSDVQKAQQIDLLKLAITRSEATDELNKQAIRYKKALLDAPLSQAAIEAKSAKYKAKSLPRKLANSPLVKLESLLTKEEVLLSTYRKRASSIDAEITQESSFNVQTSLEDARMQAKQAKLEFEGIEPGQDAQSAEHILSAANHVLQLSRIEMLEQKSLSRNARLSLLEARSKLLAKQIESSVTRLLNLQKLITDHRQSAATRNLDVVRNHLNALENQPQFIQKIANDNVENANKLIRLISDHDLVTKQKENITRKVQRIEQKHSSLTEQLKIAQLESSPEFGTALRKQRDLLARNDGTTNELKRQEQAMTQSRLAQFQIDALREPEAQIALSDTLALLTEDPEKTITPKEEQLIKDILKKRKSLLKRLSISYSRYIDDLSNLTSQTRLLNQQSKQYAELLNQQLLLMPTASKVGLNILPDIGTSLVLLAESDALKRTIARAAERIVLYPFEVMLVTIVLITLLLKRKQFVNKLSDMKGKVEKVHRDSMSLTVGATIITFLIALPAPLAMFAVARLIDGNEIFNQGMVDALIYGSGFFLALQFILQSVRKHGLGELHFRWKDTTLRLLKRNLIWFIWIFIPAVILYLFIESQEIALIRDSLGRVVFITAALVAAIFIYRVSNPKRGALQFSSNKKLSTTEWQIRYVVFPLAVLSPLVVAALSIYGYSYTSSQLAVYILKSFLIVIAGVLLFYTTQRAAAINERLLSLERVRAKRAAALTLIEDKESAEAAGEGIPTALDLQEIDLQTISGQTKALLKTIAAVAIGITLWNVWSGFLPAFQPLDDVHLWAVTEIVNESPNTLVITLWDLLLAIAVIVITFLAGRNIPGLLELTLLSRLSLNTGTNFAITTISRYIIVITGTIIALQLIGAQWSKLQWLVAALSVGLGFGLQEIVANFVSGIVILFERPVRIGDTVTIGDQLGTVSRIRIRATTIVDWDHREIIIPNKTFITERLINWTLTDPIMRSVIDVGVAYGSDVAQVEQCLMEIVRNNAKVLDDPPPTVLFRFFGDSSLDFQVRVFIKGIHDLPLVIHELHVAIDREFRNNGIEISFPQRDVNFGSKPLEVRLIDSDGAEVNR